MSDKVIVTVRVFGVRTANNCGPQDGWRDATEWVARSLKTRFGDRVRVEYFDLFLDALEAFPQAMELVARGTAKPPLVFVSDELLSSGERISGPAIRRRLGVGAYESEMIKINPIEKALVLLGETGQSYRYEIPPPDRFGNEK